MLHGARARAFACWLALAAAKRDALARLTWAAQRWHNAKLVPAWVVWCAAAEEGARRTAALRGAAASLRRRGVRAALNSLIELCDEAARRAHIATLLRMREAGALLRTWAAFAATSRELADAAMIKAARHACLFRHGEARALRALGDATARRRACRALLRRVASPRQLAALNAWADYVAARHEQMWLLRRAANCMVGRLLGLTFGSWACGVREAVEERTALAAQVDQLRRLGGLDGAAADALRFSCLQWRRVREARALARWEAEVRGAREAAACGHEAGRFATFHWAHGPHLPQHLTLALTQTLTCP